jgi:uncharacterized protein YbbC (DUF1343 family)
MPKGETAVLYPGTCLLEGTNLSEGRGTALPFEVAGAPWLAGPQLASQLNSLDLPGIKFRPVQFTPTANKWQGQCCAGVQLHVTDRQVLRPVTMVLHLFTAVYHMCPTDFAWNLPHFDHLVGTNEVRDAIEKETAVTDIVAGWTADLAQYRSLSKAIHIYPN